MRVNREIVWGGYVCLGKIESRRWLLMDGGGRWVVCWDVSKARGRVLQLFTHVSGVALHVTRQGGVGFGRWGSCMEFVQSVSQVLYHVNTGVALNAAL